LLDLPFSILNIQAVASAEQMLPQADAALAQAELAAGETLVIPAAEAAAEANFAPLADTVYVVKPGDTLSGIAWAFYGDGNLWPRIFNANTDKIASPHWIYPNQQFVIPSPVYQATAVQNQPVVYRAVASIRQYTVQPGDTLSGIAAYAYGNGNAWRGIYQANTDKIYNPDLTFQARC
jgi:nucleoid-associated protein YgaU